MARPINMEILEQKIEKAEQNVIRTKKAYATAITELKKLLDKRDAVRREELISAIAKSSKSYEEILSFLSKSTEEAS